MGKGYTDTCGGAGVGEFGCGYWHHLNHAIRYERLFIKSIPCLVCRRYLE